MKEPERRLVRAVRWRCSVNRLLDHLSITLLVTGGVGVLLVLAEKVFALNFWEGFILQIPFWVGLGIGILIWRLTRPSWMTLAMLLDKRAQLRERVSSIPALSKNREDPFAFAALEESRRAIQNVKVSTCFPLRLPGRSVYLLVVWGLLVAGWLFLPQGDLLGRLARERERTRKTIQIEQVRVQTQAAVKKVRELGEKMNQDLLGDIQDPSADVDGAKGPGPSRQLAVRQVSDLRKRVEQVRSDPAFAGLEQMERKLRQLRSPDAGPLREMAQQLAKGDFGKAAEHLKQLQDKLLTNEMNDQERAQLARQLESLSGQLQELARQQWKMENELKQNGLDPSLAKDLKKLQEALKKTRLSETQKKKLLDNARANLAACKNCQGLAGAMQSAAQNLGQAMNDPSASESLREIAENLDELESLSQQMELAQATLSDLEEAMSSLADGGEDCPGCKGEGCGMCQGKGPWREGESSGRSMSMGGPGQGQGQIADVEPTDTNEQKTKAKSDTGVGPVIASWFIQDSQVKGESVREFSAVARSARQEADESMENQHIPREYQNAVKKYFGQLNKSSLESAQKQEGN